MVLRGIPSSPRIFDLASSSLGTHKLLRNFLIYLSLVFLCEINVFSDCFMASIFPIVMT